MKVLHIYKSFYPETRGGVEEAILQIISATSKYGIRSDVLTTNKKHQKITYFYKDIKVISVPSIIEFASTPISLSLVYSFRKIMNQYDIIHYHFPFPMCDILNLFCKKKTVITYHSDIIRQKKILRFYEPFMHRFLTKVDCIAATSINYINSSKTLGIYSSKTVNIPLGLSDVSCDSINNDQVRNWKKIYGKKFFLFVGVLRYYKGLNYLLRAIENTNFPLVIAGSGEMDKDLRKYVEEKNIKDIFFTGYISDEEKHSLISSCYAFVFPSHLRSEAFGLSLIEALIHGKPIISCEIGTGTSFVNKNGLTGLVVPPKDVKALNAAMKILWSDSKLVSKFGKAARERYEKKFESLHMALGYYNLYSKLLK